MSNAWDAIRAAIEEERAGHIYEGKRTGDRMSEADRKRLGTCVAGCGHDDGEERRELRRAVEEEMLPARDLVERQDSPEESFMASIRSSIFAAATTAGMKQGASRSIVCSVLTILPRYCNRRYHYRQSFIRYHTRPRCGDHN